VSTTPPVGPAADPVAGLLAAGIPAGRAQALVSAGLTAEVGGHLVVVGEMTDRLSGERMVLVAGGADAVVRDAHLTDELRTLVARRHPGVGTLMVRAERESEPAAAIGAQLVMRYVESGPPPVSAPPESEWRVRPYEAADREPVADLLARAIEAGYTSVGVPAAEPQTRQFVDDLLDRTDDDVTVFCAFRRDRFAGHATVVWDEDDLTGRLRPELFDVFVLPEHRATPASRLLTAAAVSWAAAAGFRLRGHVVGGDENAQAVFRRLVADGWRPAEAYWRLSTRPSHNGRR